MAGRWYEKLLFSVMGPPQLGDPDEPAAVPRDSAADRCHRCGAPWSDHERIAGPVTHLRCPSG